MQPESATNVHNQYCYIYFLSIQRGVYVSLFPQNSRPKLSLINKKRVSEDCITCISQYTSESVFLNFCPVHVMLSTHLGL